MSVDRKAHRVAVVGLGKQGQLLVERLGRRRDTELVAAVDVAPAKDGVHIDELLGQRSGFDVTVSSSLDAIVGADVALVATTSRLADVAPQLIEIADRKLDAVSTCEELAYPWHQFPELSASLDEAAKRNDVSVLGCGANPGFLMDLLPIAFTLGCERVDGIEIRRSLDMRPHRPERLTRFGLGLQPAQFEELDASTLIGHVGFTQSIHCLADALNWELESASEELVVPLVITKEERSGAFVTLPPGSVAVVEHRASATRNGKRVIDIAMFFGFHDAGDPVDHADSYRIDASDQPVALRMAPSWGPFTTTPSTVVNMISALREAAPGLRAITDFPARLLASRGSEVVADQPLPPGYNHMVSLAGE